MIGVLPARLLRRRIVILRAAEKVDRYGTKTLDWTNPSEVEVRGEVQPRQARENEVGRSLDSIDAVVYLLPNTDLTASDRVRVGDDIYSVVGPPQQVQRLGRPHHLIANITSAKG